ncbi:MAG: phosphotransferase [Pseudomonadales bacterium]|jgi:aminoglycoside/choline kinase family phosphotransferase|nr:phosphotransferase [Pseudomonadales bacterium]MCP5321982.1 phosphotransferase [Pseudomonadales bacterium]
MEALLRWCANRIAAVPGEDLRLVAVAGDASFRRYFRLLGCTPSRIAVFAPPDTERNIEFTRIAAMLRASGVHAPQVLAHGAAEGFLLLEDLGDALLLAALDESSVDVLYGRALDVLLCMQRARTSHDGWQLPSYSAGLLQQEMALFPHWYLERLLGITLDVGEEALLGALFDRLIASALAQPQVFVHRDYHSRNLMLLPEGGLGVIDFQDAVSGPLTYDAVSLLRDCYVAWPAERVAAWAGHFAARARAAGTLPPEVSVGTFMRWFDWMGLQRHIKVLGIFARLWLRDAKRGYLRDLPLVMRYTLEVALAHPETAEFGRWFASRVLPVARMQPWYHEP